MANVPNVLSVLRILSVPVGLVLAWQGATTTFLALFAFGLVSDALDGVLLQDVDFPIEMVIGEDCSITHHATLHGCRIGDRCLIGINATVMDGAVIGANSVVAGHAIVREGAAFPENAVIAGVPARQVTTRDNSAENLMNARFYLRNAENYARRLHRMDAETLRRVTEGP